MKPLYVTVTGSKLYGTNTPKSDTDFKGICFPEVHELIGLSNFEQQEFKQGPDDGPDKAEGTIFTVEKYLRLCLKGNPTVIELAFAGEDFHIHTTKIGEEVNDYVRNNMITKHLFKPYSAYHRAQIKKLQSMNRTGKRAQSVIDNGYDPKFAMHAYRLARQCVIVMEEGILRPTLDVDDREMALKIREGKVNFSKDEVLSILEDVDKDMHTAYKNSSLKEKPNFNDTQDFLVDLHHRYLKGEYDVQLQDGFDYNDL